MRGRETKARAPRLVAAGLCSLLAVLALGGCSITETLPGLVDSEPTGSIHAAGGDARFDSDDWRLAKPALLRALNAPAAAPASEWSNPATGHSGRFTAVAGWYPDGDGYCRAFVARVAAAGETRSLQAAGCSLGDGSVAVNDLKGWQGL
jgi:surface antigen